MENYQNRLAYIAATDSCELHPHKNIVVIPELWDRAILKFQALDPFKDKGQILRRLY